MNSFHDNLLADVNLLKNAISHGRLDIRADPAKYSGEYRKIIESMNTMLDTVTGPLKMSIEYTDQLSRGILPPKITGIYFGEVRRIKNNLNNCIDMINSVNKDTRSAAQDSINYSMIPGTKYGKSNFSEWINDTAHMQGDLVSMKNPFTNTSAVLPGVLSTINLQVTEIAAHYQRTRQSTTKLALDTAHVARSASVVHYHAGRGDEKVREIFKGMKELSAGIREISSDTGAAVHLAKTTYQLSGAASDHVDQVRKELTGISQASSEVDTYIANLLNLVDRIGDNTGHIVTLSELIKLQVANASNDRGKLVKFHDKVPDAAQEITYLTEEFRQSAKKMSCLIKDLQTKSGQVKSALENMNNALENGNTAFNNTFDLVTRLAGSAGQISRTMEDVLAASISHQRSAMKLTAQVQNVNYVIQGTAERASDIAETCKNTSSSLYQVARNMADVNRYAQNVASGTAKYQA
jgi:methyl-accepting chemotaxis protein